ncbi:MAG: PAAR domain-containing protein [Erythrobacter sp.]
MPPAARITDMHTCPMVNPGPVPHVGGPVIKGQPNVLTCMMPQARVTDTCVCVGPPDVIVKGSLTVLVGGLPAARLGDLTVHGGVITTGVPNVLIGDSMNMDAGMGVAAPSMLNTVPFSAPNLQGEAMIAAHKAAKPFCRLCEA